MDQNTMIAIVVGAGLAIMSVMMVNKNHSNADFVTTNLQELSSGKHSSTQGYTGGVPREPGIKRFTIKRHTSPLFKHNTGDIQHRNFSEGERHQDYGQIET
jgi:hypothetical protein